MYGRVHGEVEERGNSKSSMVVLAGTHGSERWLVVPASQAAILYLIRVFCLGGSYHGLGHLGKGYRWDEGGRRKRLTTGLLERRTGRR
jgi:hypothetical protein